MAGAGVIAGLCGAYWLYSGMVHLIMPAILGSGISFAIGAPLF